MGNNGYSKRKVEEVAFLDSDIGLSYKLADIGDRFFALIIDNIIISFLLMILVGRLGFLGGALSFLAYFTYHTIFWVKNNGQTPGKVITGIRVVKANGTAIEPADAVLRYIGYIINNVLFLLWFWAMFDSNKQGLHDKIAHTYVVKVNSEQVVPLEPDYKQKR